jgi:hypothetical protein
MELLKATEIKLARRGDHVVAVVGFDLKGEPRGSRFRADRAP